MKTENRLLMILVCLLFFSVSQLFSDGLNLIDKDGLKFVLSLRTGLFGGYSLSGNRVEYPVSMTDISLDGELNKSLGISISLDAEIPGADISNSSSVSFKDICAFYEFADYLKLTLGRFRLPFGEEVTESVSERPYISRPYISRKITPDRDIGLEVSGKKILDLFGYSAGVFTGYSDDMPDDADITFLLAGKIFVKYDDIDLIRIKAGYAGFYHYYVSGVPTHHLAQNLFIRLQSSFGKKNDLTLLAEYQERLRIRNVVNQNLDYTRGLLGTLSYRYKFIEPFIMCEIYDGSLLYENGEDIFTFSAGAAGFFLKDDVVRVKLLYSLEYPLYSEAPAHKISAMLFLQI